MNVQMHETGRRRGGHSAQCLRRTILAKPRCGIARALVHGCSPRAERRAQKVSAPRARLGLNRRPRSSADDAQHLRPDRDHGQEQADGCQRQRFLGNCANHVLSPLERTENIVPLLFPVNAWVVGQFEMWQRLKLNLLQRAWSKVVALYLGLHEPTTENPLLPTDISDLIDRHFRAARFQLDDIAGLKHKALRHAGFCRQELRLIASASSFQDGKGPLGIGDYGHVLRGRAGSLLDYTFMLSVKHFYSNLEPSFNCQLSQSN